ncbi:tyrosine-type recombinase/integrase [Streptomyces sp. NPDC051576]|uniref:tyrosine-type recombinase/integrase n=1 Tax=Streptomyces sp. NPDC051576 TaxID=3155803 RepID=UPI00343EB3A9
MKEAAGDAWQDYNLVFCRPDGSPIDPHDDWEEFKELLEEAGITDRRLYDGSRHTTGTILNELKVDMPTIMEILRRTQISQTRRYVKGRSHLSQDAMRRMGDTFMPGSATAPEPPTETGTETRDRRAARSRARRRIR